MTKVSPSILSADFSRLGEEIMRTDEAGADWIHLDVMDGMFVPNITFGPPVIKSVRKYSNKMFDAHLMIDDPVRYIDAFAEAGCDSITVHCEAKGDIGAAISRIKEHGLKAGISINPENPVEMLVPYLPKVDLVLVMTVHPGFGGQSFIEGCIPKIHSVAGWAEDHRPGMAISVDGGINDETGRRCVEAGANVLVAGSHLFRSEDMKGIIGNWRALGPDPGWRYGSKPVPDSGVHPHRDGGTQRKDRGHRCLQYDLPIPFHHKAERREAPDRFRRQCHISSVRSALPYGQPYRERHRAVLRLRRQAQ